jgi:hypothetical protein
MGANGTKGKHGGGQEEKQTHRLYISETISISASACAIFCSDEICGRPPMPKKDMLICFDFESASCRDDWCGVLVFEAGLRVELVLCVVLLQSGDAMMSLELGF